MMKRLFSAVLVCLIINFSFPPVFAKTAYGSFYDVNTILVSDLNVNKSSKGQIIQFKSSEDCKTETGFTIPKDTIFQGSILSMKKSRFGFRRAKAKIQINEIILPDGRKYAAEGHTKPGVLKGSATGNLFKGILGVPLTICTGALGVAVIIVETCTIVGIVLVPATAAAVGSSMGKLTNGVNCKKYSGTDLVLHVKSNIVDYPEIKSINKNDNIPFIQPVSNIVDVTDIKNENYTETGITKNDITTEEQQTNEILPPDMLSPLIRVIKIDD